MSFPLKLCALITNSVPRRRHIRRARCLRYLGVMTELDFSMWPPIKSVAEFTGAQMKDEPKTAQQPEESNKTKSRAYFRPSFPRPELWRQLKEAIFLPRMGQIARAIYRWARRQLARNRKWTIGLPRILYSRWRELLRIEKTSALSEE